MHGRQGIQVDAAVDACHAPMVLILQEAAIAPADHLGGQEVLARVHQLGDVKLGRQARSLAIADQLAVDPEIERRLDALKAQNDAAPLPIVRHIERRAIEAGRVVVLRNVGRRVGDRHLDIGIDRLVKPLHGPVAGHLDGVPIGSIVIGLAEDGVHGLGVGGQREIPPSVQAAVPGRGARIAAQRPGDIIVGDAGYMSRQLVDGDDLGVHPVMRRRSGIRV